MTLEELQKRVRVLQDIEEIKKMHRNYIFCLSNLQWEEMIDCFAEIATVEIAVHGVLGEYDIGKGKEQIAKILRDVIGKRALEIRPKGGHILIQPIITVEGDTAIGQWMMSRYIYDLNTSGGLVPQLSRGLYDCEYVREGGKWKFSYLKWTQPWPESESKP